MASNADYFVEVGTPGSATILSNPGHAVGDPTFKVNSTAGFPAIGKSVIFAVDTFTVQTVNGVSTQVRTPGTYTEWEGIVTDATTISTAIIRYGSDQPYAFDGSCRVYIPVSSSRENRLAQGIQVHANQDGTLIPAAVQTAISANSISFSKLDLTTVPLVRITSNTTQPVNDTTGAQNQINMPNTIFNHGNFTISNNAITINTPGIYVVSGEVGTTDVVNFLPYVTKNNTNTIQTLGFRGTQTGQNGYENSTGSMPHQFVAGDVITLQYQNRATATTIVSATLALQQVGA